MIELLQNIQHQTKQGKKNWETATVMGDGVDQDMKILEVKKWKDALDRNE
jgi:hypothetical protein